MQLDISNALKAPGVTFGFSVTENLEPMCAGGEEIRFIQPVEVSGGFVFTGDNILLKGSVKAQYQAECCRCLKAVTASMQIPFSEEYAKVEDEEHPDRYLYRGEQLVLSPMVEDLISLNTPMRHLCSESCKGLCPVCGADRNETRCGCQSGDDGVTEEN